jgi:uncharacterized protein
VQFIHEFAVGGTPQDVIQHFADVPAMAGLLPGASVGERQEDGSYPATLVVSFGPKRIAFKGSLTNNVDVAKLCGTLQGRASADIRGARMIVAMNYRLAEGPASDVPRTQVRLESEAELSGVLGEFAKTGGAVVVEAMLAEFARRFSEEFGPKKPLAQTVAIDDSAARVEPATAADRRRLEATQALSATTLLASVLRLGLRRVGRWFARLFGSQAPKA